MLTPSDYELPSHLTEFRPGQLDAINWALHLDHIGILAAPTGSGKTAIARAVASRKPVVGLVRTKILQDSVYVEHGFDILQGKSNYACSLNSEERADVCPYDNVEVVVDEVVNGKRTGRKKKHSLKMRECPVFSSCQYNTALRIAKVSRRASLNYTLYHNAWWLSSHPPAVLIMDECHQLPDEVLNWVGIFISEKDIMGFALPRPPELLADGSLDLSRSAPASLDIIPYLEDVAAVMRGQLSRHKGMADPYNRRQAARLERMIDNCDRAAKWIEEDPLLWFVESTRNAMVAKPLTARYHWAEMFDKFPNAVLMSATVGNFDTLAAELGIAEFDRHRVPNRFPPERRPVVALDVPRLSYRSPDSDFDAQAKAIATSILSFDPAWYGVIHVNKKKAAPDLADRLARYGLQDRIWVAPDTKYGTGYQFRSWEEWKRKCKAEGKSGQIAIAYSWHEGVSLDDEKICVCAKAPFPDLSSKYERARFEYDKRFYLQRTAWDIQQQLGRTRRGREEDYDTEEEVRGFVAIADGNWSKVRNFMDEDFRESILDMKEIL